jgi:putative phosphoesterase
MSEVTPIDATRIAVLADCHIHPGGGPDWSEAVLAALAGVDLIVTLGDMGEAAGLDRLGAIAPVIGVRGADDGDDARTAFQARTLESGNVRIGCVFDAVASGLAGETNPFMPTETWKEQIGVLFGGPIQVLLHAATHRPYLGNMEGILLINPGSALLPAEGSEPSFAVVGLDGEGVDAAIVPVAKPA